MSAARILIADDHSAWRSGMRIFLERHPGWRVCAEVEDGAQTVSKAPELKPDVIVLDLAMPVMNGLSAAREIHRDLPTIPVLINTIYNFPQTEVEAKKVGVRAIISKENTTALVNAIEAVLDQGIAHE